MVCIEYAAARRQPAADVLVRAAEEGGAAAATDAVADIADDAAFMLGAPTAAALIDKGRRTLVVACAAVRARGALPSRGVGRTSTSARTSCWGR